MAVAEGDVKIRPLVVSDYPALCSLWKADGYCSRSAQDTEAGLKSFLSRNGGYCFAAEASGDVVGFIMVGCDGRSARVYHLVVDSVWRRRGIAHCLTERVGEVLSTEGVSDVGVIVYREDSSAVFWESEGFKDRAQISIKSFEDF